MVFTALHTDSLQEASAKVTEIERLQDAVWEAKLVGRNLDADKLYEQLQSVAQMRGFKYIPARSLGSVDLVELLDRVEVIDKVPPTDASVVADAVLGAVDEPMMPLSDLVVRVEGLSKDKLINHSADQLRRWRNARSRAVEDLISVVGDKPTRNVSRADALRFRFWWWGRIERGDVKAGTANKSFNYLGSMFSVINRFDQTDIRNPFHGLRFEANDEDEVPPFSVTWIQDVLLAPSAFHGLNDEARDGLLGMINTGARPSEILGMRSTGIVLDHEIPHLDIEPADNRRLKTTSSRRKIPLLGVSLEAFERNPDGFPRYREKPSSWSNLVMKYLRNNGLLETPEHRSYSLRHSFQDALQNVDCPDRTRKELMGHVIPGIVYGDGASLQNKADWLSKVAY